MKRSIKMLNDDKMNVSLQISKKFEVFKKIFIQEIYKLLSEVNAKEIDISPNYFFVSGYFMIDEKLFYFSTGDVRARKELYLEVEYNRNDKIKRGWYIPMNDVDEFIAKFKEIVRLGV